MDKEKVKLIIRNMELLLDSLKAELYSDNKTNSSNSLSNNNDYYQFDDYDEIFDE